MSYAIARTRKFAYSSAEFARFVIVTACAAALIVAGQAFPV